MKYLDENGASRLLAKIKAYADRKVAEVDLRGGGTVGGNIVFGGLVSFTCDIEGDVAINGYLAAQWIEPWEGNKWGINIEGDAHFVNITATEALTTPAGVFDYVEIGEVPADVDRSISLRVGSGGIGTLGSITANGTVWANELMVWDSAIFDSGANFEGAAIFNANAQFSDVGVLGSICGYGAEANVQTWKIYPAGRAEFEQVDVSRFSSTEYADFNDVDFNGSVNALDVYFHDVISGYKNNILTWYIASNGWAKFAKIINISEFYQIPDDVLAKFDSANLLNALQSLITMEYGDLNLDPSSLQVTGYVVNTLAPNTAFVRISVGFQLALGENILFAPGADKATCAKLTADGETVLMIPLSTDYAGFFEYWFPVNKTNWSFISNAKYKLGVVYTDSMNSN